MEDKDREDWIIGEGDCYPAFNNKNRGNYHDKIEPCNTGEKLRGKKLVVVPTSLLENQWKKRIEKFCNNPQDWEVRTYSYLSTNNNVNKYTGNNGENLILTIFDENHAIPADTWSKTVMINTKYRIGLSATPYREDYRMDFAFAMTGKPVGLNWQEMVDVGAADIPKVTIEIVENYHEKKQLVKEKLEEIIGKTIIFCDSIEKEKNYQNTLIYHLFMVKQIKKEKL